MKKLMMIAAMIAAFGFGGAAAVAASGDKPPSNPGSPADNCSHGNSNKPCKEDPQPDRGKDCDDHGQARGNEDHCEEVDTTHTDTTDTTHTDTTDTTHTDTTDTTHTDTTGTTHTDTTDTTGTTQTETTGTTQTETTETTTTEETSTEEEPQVFTPPTADKPAKNNGGTAVAGVVQAPSTAAQAAPLTP